LRPLQHSACDCRLTFCSLRVQRNWCCVVFQSPRKPSTDCQKLYSLLLC